MTDPRPRGRFAPTPSGPLHFGSLIAAVGSYLHARARGGTWVLRIDDIDTPRVVPGASDAILCALDAYGFEWTGPVYYQSAHIHAYAAALARLQTDAMAYPCACSRREIADSSLHGIDSPIYPGTCRHGLPPGRSARAWRVRTEGATIAFVDLWQGALTRDLAREIGDFVVCRADGLFAYQLTAVIDDAAQGVTEVVRGADLIESTARQIHLQHLLDLPTPAYGHLPVAVNAQGEKLSKQMGAAPLDVSARAVTLHRALAFLGQDPPSGLELEDITTLWEWALAHWRPHCVPRERVLRF